MKTKKEDIFKKVLQQAKPGKPSADFTAVVMNEILAGMSGEASVNPALKTLAQKHLKVGAPAGFTENVMAGIAQVPRLSPYQPVLSKKVLMSIAASVILLISVIFLTARPKAPAQELHLQNKWSEVITELSRASHPWILAIIVAGALLYTDFLLNPNRRHQLER